LTLRSKVIKRIFGWGGKEEVFCVWNEKVLELCLDIKAKTSLGILGKFLRLEIISYAKSFIILSL
jgi:hypothetical protein